MKRVTLGNLEIDGQRFEARVGGEPVGLTFTEFEILSHLAGRRGHVVLHGELIGALWGEVAEDYRPRLSVHISRLRRKLSNSRPWEIRTVQKRGYALAQAMEPVRNGPIRSHARARRARAQGTTV